CDVVTNRQRRDQAPGLAVLGDEGKTGRDGSSGRRDSPDSATDADASGDASVSMDPEDRLEQLGASGTEQAGDPDDLTGTHRERHRPDGPAAGRLVRHQLQLVDPQHLVAEYRVGSREQVAERT